MSSRRPPTFMPTTPSSQPWMTWPWPRANENGCPRFHDASNSFFLVQEYPSYWTVTVWPAFAVAPVPTMRFQASSCGGGPDGTVTLGRVPKVPAGERSAAGIGVIPATAVPVGLAADVVGIEGGSARVDVVVAVVGLDEQAAVARARAALTPTRMNRRFDGQCRGMAARLVADPLRFASLRPGLAGPTQGHDDDSVHITRRGGGRGSR